MFSSSLSSIRSSQASYAFFASSSRELLFSSSFLSTFSSLESTVSFCSAGVSFPSSLFFVSSFFAETFFFLLSFLFFHPINAESASLRFSSRASCFSLCFYFSARYRSSSSFVFASFQAKKVFSACVRLSSSSIFLFSSASLFFSSSSFFFT